jgi:hypothetical protein
MSVFWWVIHVLTVVSIVKLLDIDLRFLRDPRIDRWRDLDNFIEYTN